jgi:hypothetical protein
MQSSSTDYPPLQVAAGLTDSLRNEIRLKLEKQTPETVAALMPRLGMTSSGDKFKDIKKFNNAAKQNNKGFYEVNGSKFETAADFDKILQEVKNELKQDTPPPAPPVQPPSPPLTNDVKPTYLPGNEHTNVKPTYLPGNEHTNVKPTYLPGNEHTNVKPTYLPGDEHTNVRPTYLPENAYLPGIDTNVKPTYLPGNEHTNVKPTYLPGTIVPVDNKQIIPIRYTPTTISTTLTQGRDALQKIVQDKSLDDNSKRVVSNLLEADQAIIESVQDILQRYPKTKPSLLALLEVMMATQLKLTQIRCPPANLGNFVDVLTKKFNAINQYMDNITPN